jgi:DNA-binding winged helix-turn-helix (wHTH) protein
MILCFGEFTLNPATRELTRGGLSKHLSTKAFDLLCLLAARRPAVVEKAELRQHLWPATHVVDAALANLIAEIRRTLGDDPAAPTILRTVHGVGYAFAAETTGAGDSSAVGPLGREPLAANPPAAVRCWLAWRQRVFTLAPGAHVIGRDPSCSVWIDVPGVSRRHARLTVPADARDPHAVIEDLGSTNGTFARGQRTTGTEIVRDGDAIRLGRVALVFRVWNGADAPTKRVR